MSYSVLMPVYYKEKPEYFRESIESMLRQTLPTDDFVIICDGPLTPELDGVIEFYKDRPEINVVRLKKNIGLGNALNEGIKHCKNDIIARMDSDDISFDNRCEKQYEFMVKNNIDILSASMFEFVNSTDNIVSIKTVPETHEEIVRYTRKRSPFNHPAVMMRKSAVLKVGGYQDFYFLEDYHLWVRMLSGDVKSYNLMEPYVFFRCNADMYARRGGFKYLRSIIKLASWMKKECFITWWDYITVIVGRSMVCLIPGFLRAFFYRRFLREKPEK